MTDMLAKEGQSETVDFRDASLTIDASAHVRDSKTCATYLFRSQS